MKEHFDYFLVSYDEKGKYETAQKRRNEILDYLKKENFKCLGDCGCPWFFVDIINKEYYGGKAGISYGRVVGDHAITLNEFKTIYEIYTKYNGLNTLEMSNQNKN